MRNASTSRSMEWFVLLPFESSYFRGVAQGVATFLLGRPHWHLNVGDETGMARLTGKGAGPIIGVFNNETLQRLARQTVRPVVNVSAHYVNPGIASVTPDNLAIGRLAAEHLLSLGHRSFACVDMEGPFARERYAGFSEVLAKHGHHPLQLRLNADLPGQLRELPRPLAVFVAVDRLARRFVKLCRLQAIGVPAEMAVVGVDNDPLFCVQMAPQLTSVDPNAVKVGYEAAALVERMLKGAVVGPDHVQVPPIGIVQRESTSALGVTSPPLAKALAYVRTQQLGVPRVADIAAASGTSRRTLLNLCRLHLGTTLKQQIREHQLVRARQMLLETGMSLCELSVACGFTHYGRFTQQFRKRFGETPSRCRRQGQSG